MDCHPACLSWDDPGNIRVDRLVPGGWGLGALGSGEKIFIGGSVPGDEYRLLRYQVRAGALFAKEAMLVRPGSHRMVPSCPHAQDCGGCDWMHIDLPAQRQFKVSLLNDAISRITRAGWVAVSHARSDGPALGYRTRVRLHVDEQGLIGFQSRRSHQLVPVGQCPIASHPLQGVINRLGIASTLLRRELANVEVLELRCPDGAPTPVVRAFPRLGRRFRVDPLREALNDLGPLVEAGKGEERTQWQPQRHVEDIVLRIPFSSFFQINPWVNSLLVSEIVSGARQRGARSFIDPYCGAGNLGIPLMRCGMSGKLSDLEPTSVHAARGVARDLGLPFTDFEVGPADEVMTRAACQGSQFDLVVLDPPRSGAIAALAPALALRPKYLALVGCDPVSLARDLGWLVARGVAVESLTPFDMFPHTHHVETLAWLAVSP